MKRGAEGVATVADGGGVVSRRHVRPGAGVGEAGGAAVGGWYSDVGAGVRVGAGKQAALGAVCQRAQRAMRGPWAGGE